MIYRMARWRWIRGYEGLYQVSDQADVRSYQRPIPRLLVHQRNRTGYSYVLLSDGVNPRARVHNVHTLVAEAFLGPRPAGAVIRHLDDDKKNNAASNLKYGTHAENMADVTVAKAANNAKKRRCPWGHRYVGPNLKHTKAGGRHCRACAYTRNQARREGWADVPRSDPRWRAAADVQYEKIMKGFVDPEPEDPMPYGADPEMMQLVMSKGTMEAASRALYRLAKDDREADMVRGWFERSASEFYYATMKAESMGFPLRWDGKLPTVTNTLDDGVAS